MESMCVLSAQQVKEPNPSSQVLTEAEFQCTAWGQPPPLLHGLGGPQGKSSLLSCPQSEEMTPCSRVPSCLTTEEEPHIGTWCQEHGLSGA